MNRRWITREEIAEIHEVIAAQSYRKAQEKLAIAESVPLPAKVEYDVFRDEMNHAADHRDRAQVIREIEKVGRG